MQSNNVKPKTEFKTNIKARSYYFALDIIDLINTLDKKDWSSEIIAKQLIRSSTSIGANIIEAQAGRTRKDFTNFYTHALKSANETKFWLALLRDSKKTNINNIAKLLKEVTEIANMLGSSIIIATAKQKVNFLRNH